MSMVCFLKFDEHSGAIVSDEEFWSLRYRRKLFADNIHSLLDEEMSEAWNMEVAYAGAGWPSLNWEIIAKTKAKLKERFLKKGKKGNYPQIKTVEDVARVVHESMQEVMRKRIDLRMKFFFGFELDDLNQGSFSYQDKTYEIKQEQIKDKAMKIAQGQEPSRLMKLIFNTRAGIFGWDSVNGIIGYYLDPKNSVLSFNYEGWEAIGAGKYASGMVIGQFLNRKSLAMRKKGYSPAEGMLELISASIQAIDNFHEAGGNLSIVILNGQNKTHSERYREILDNTAHLGMEIVRAYLADNISRADAMEMIDEIFFKNKELNEVEKKLFKQSKNIEALDLILRGYKLDEVPELISLKAASTKGKK